MAAEISSQPGGGLAPPPALSTHSLYNVFINDLICGSMGGLAYILTAHPLDSIKVRM
jgi:hypothetical protein